MSSSLEGAATLLRCFFQPSDPLLRLRILCVLAARKIRGQLRGTQISFTRERLLFSKSSPVCCDCGKSERGHSLAPASKSVGCVIGCDVHSGRVLCRGGRVNVEGWETGVSRGSRPGRVVGPMIRKSVGSQHTRRTACTANRLVSSDADLGRQQSAGVRLMRFPNHQGKSAPHSFPTAADCRFGIN